MKPIDLPIDADLARDLMIEARRRGCDVGSLVRGTLAELLERLEGEGVAPRIGRWDRPEFYEYTFETHLTCDDCRAVFTLRSIGIDTDDAQRERAHQATIEASAKGWSVAGGHRCPACAVAPVTCGRVHLDVARDSGTRCTRPADHDGGCQGDALSPDEVTAAQARRLTALAAKFADGTAPGTERLHGDRCMCAGAGCRERAAR